MAFSFESYSGELEGRIVSTSSSCKICGTDFAKLQDKGRTALQDLGKLYCILNIRDLAIFFCMFLIAVYTSSGSGLQALTCLAEP